jgi:hypothetical protein
VRRDGFLDQNDLFNRVVIDLCSSKYRCRVEARCCNLRRSDVQHAEAGKRTKGKAEPEEPEKSL